MPKPHRRAATAALFVASAIVVTACTGGAEDGGPRGTLTFTDSFGFPENLFPAIAAGNSPAVTNTLIRILPAPFRTLPDYTIGVDENLIVGEPTLNVTATRQIVTYRINPDAVWSDGIEITADDFAFTWDLQHSSDPADGGCPALLSTVGYDQIESVEGSDAGKTVTVTYRAPFPDWKALFTLFPAHIMDTGDDVSNCTAVTRGWPIGTGIPDDISGGTWQLLAENIDQNSQVLSLTPNPRWYGAGPLLQRLNFQTVGREPSVLLGALQSGEADLIYPSPQLDMIRRVQALAPDVVSQTDFGLVFDHLDLNTANVHLAKPEVRAAFGLALDRAEIVEVTVGAIDDRAKVLNNRFHVNNQPQYVDTAPERYNARDVEAARGQLESVGYVLGSDGVYAHLTDGRLALQLSTLPNDPLRADTIAVVAAQVREAGFDIEPVIDRDIFEGANAATSLESAVSTSLCSRGSHRRTCPATCPCTGPGARRTTPACTMPRSTTCSIS